MKRNVTRVFCLFLILLQFVSFVRPALAADADKTVPDGKYRIFVVDTKGEPVEGASVTWETSKEGKFQETTNSDGYADFPRSTTGPLRITVTHDNYLEWNNNYAGWKKSAKHYETVVLNSDQKTNLSLQSAMCKSRGDVRDVMKEVMQLNCDPSEKTVPFVDMTRGEFTLTCNAQVPEDVDHYYLYQNGKCIEDNQEGVFHLETKKFAKGAGVYVKTEDSDGNFFINNLLLEFYAVDFVKDIFSINLGSLSIGVPDHVPFVGGTKFDVNLPVEIPLSIAISEGKVRLGMGIPDFGSADRRLQASLDAKKLLGELSSAGINKPGKLSESQQEKFNELTEKSNKAKFFQPFEIRVLGYAEFDCGDFTKGEKLKRVTGNVVFQFSREAVNTSWTTWVVVVPVTINCKITMGMNAATTLTFDLETDSLDGNLILSPYLAVNVFGGIGVGRAIGAGAYGNAQIQGDFEVVPTPRLRAISLTGELGVKAYVWIFSYSKTFAKDTWYIYKNSDLYSRGIDGGASYFNALLGMNDFSQYKEASLSYLDNEGAWISERDDYVPRGDDAETAFTLMLGNTYRNAQPVMVSANGKLYAAFVRADNTSGRVYTVVSKYENGIWSPLHETQTDAVLDGEPQLVVSGDSIYLAYLRMPSSMDRKTIAALDTESQMILYAKAQQLVVGRLNPDTLEFTEERVFEGEGYLHSFTMSATDDSVTLAWFDSKLEGASSVLSQTDSVICTVTKDRNGWSATQKVASVSGDTGSIILGERDGETLVAYTMENSIDENGETSASLYVVGKDGTAECITDNCGGKVTFGKLPGTEQSDFVWNADDKLVNAAGESIVIPNVNNSYVIADDTIYYSASGDSCGNLTTMRYIDGDWTSAMEMIADNAYLENLSVAILEGKPYVMGMNTTVTIGEDDYLDDTKDLVFVELGSVSDLVLEDILYDTSSLVAGEDTTLDLYVFNEGDHPVTSVDVLLNGELIATKAIEIPLNMTNTIPITIRCPSDVTTYSFEVRETGMKQHCVGKNTMSTTLGYGDFAVELERRNFGSGQLVSVAVSNEGISTAEGKLQIYADDGVETTLFYEEDIFLFANEVYVHSETANQIPRGGSAVTLTAVITPTTPDLYTMNNSDSLTVYFDEVEYVNYENMMILPAAVRAIEDEAFAGSGIEAVETGAALESIGSHAFANCAALKQVRVGYSVTFIADDAFLGSGEVILWCPYGSYAAEYAYAHGINYMLY